MRVFATDRFTLPLPAGHTFPAAKYRRLREEVLAAGLVADGDLLVPEAAGDVEILRVHSPDYLGRVRSGTLSPAEVRELGLPWSPELVERSLRSCGATLAAARAVAGSDPPAVAVNLAGGTHHAFRDRGAGYCVFNDAAVAARAVQAEGNTRRVVILDCDVHQGDGTAAIFADDPSVFTFSIHGAKNYPLRKQKSDLDIALEDGTGDGPYLEALEAGIGAALERSEAELAIYLAGADPYAGDRLGRLKLTRSGLARRDRLVLEACRGAGLPVVIAMAGGYARDIEDTVAIHLETVRIAASLSGFN
jgi:acetoin utilization deacetylase AcuC-like enzyme